MNKESNSSLLQVALLCAGILLSLQVQSNQFISENENLEAQRKIFKTLKDENKLGKVNPVDYRHQLADYPLFPYIEYYYLLNKIGDEDLESYTKFFSENDDLASSSYLRKQLLLYLGEQEDWDNFNTFYKNEEYFFSKSDVLKIKCYLMQGELAKKAVENLNIQETEEYLLNEAQINSIQNMYLTGNSLPNSCDPIILIFEEQNHLSDQLKLQRIHLALKENNFGLASFISKSLSDNELVQYKFFESLKSKPTLLKKSETVAQDTEFTRFAVIYAL